MRYGWLLVSRAAFRRFVKTFGTGETDEAEMFAAVSLSLLGGVFVCRWWKSLWRSRLKTTKYRLSKCKNCSFEHYCPNSRKFHVKVFTKQQFSPITAFRLQSGLFITNKSNTFVAFANVPLSFRKITDPKIISDFIDLFDRRKQNTSSCA